MSRFVFRGEHSFEIASLLFGAANLCDSAALSCSAIWHELAQPNDDSKLRQAGRSKECNLEVLADDSDVSKLADLSEEKLQDFSAKEIV